jgi:hypothetical protein
MTEVLAATEQRKTEPRYEEHFTAFVDFLGFSEATIGRDGDARLRILNLLLSLSALRGEFDIKSEARGDGKTTYLKPAISTFSDHIVISYPLAAVRRDMGTEQLTALTVVHHFQQLLTRFAAAAIDIGFLIRGGATIGNLYHSQGVVFGEALLEAYRLESRTSVYPRVVLSTQVTSKADWMQHAKLFALRDSDGLWHIDYFLSILQLGVPAGDDYKQSLRKWFGDVVSLIDKNLTELSEAGRLNEFAKWAWFANHLRESLQRMHPGYFESMGISLSSIPSPK